jgi:uncharacterized membrane protein YphA (DoxX/SURF4 family)
MLSIFPTLLSYNMLAPFAFRLIGGALFIYFGYAIITSLGRKEQEPTETAPKNPETGSGKIWLWILALIEIFGGILLVTGLFTQASALVLSIILVLSFTGKYKNSINTLSLSSGFMFMLLIIVASLMLLGPGFYSIDLPL